MKTVNVATLKEKLSEYLHRVEQGEEWVVVSHRRPVARLVPEQSAPLIIRRGSVSAGAISALKGVKPIKPFPVDAVLAQDRGRR